MLATSVREPFHDPKWLYEVKWDGFRTLVYADSGGHVNLCSRNNKSFNEKFYPLFQAFQKLKLNVVLDGEVVVLDNNGMPDFNGLQGWRSEADGRLVYYVFDLLWLEGEDLTQQPLSKRRELLLSTLKENSQIRISHELKASGTELYEAAAKMVLEGIIAKKRSGLYRPGKRTRDWLKIKVARHQDVVIAGFTRNEGSSRPFSALVAGVFKEGVLTPIAPIGTGFSQDVQRSLMKKMKPLITSKCPFSTVPDLSKPSRFRPNPPAVEVTWVKPVLVAEIAYQTIGGDGNYRHPSFRGLRPDKKPKDARREVSIARPSGSGSLASVFAPQKKERRTLLNPSDKTQVRTVGGHTLRFSSLDKIYWPDVKVTKRDLINYYYQVAPVMLRYLRNRPQTLNRFPHGIKGESFYQKDVKGKVPDWVKTFPYYSEADEREKEFFVCTGEASLLYMANLGCLEINPWSSRTAVPDNPDWCIIDLDPSKGNPFSQVIEAAQATKAVLDARKIPSFCKTSGSSGLHIYVPLPEGSTYEDSKEFARGVVTEVHQMIPAFTSIERLTKNRKGKLYLDFLQNRPQATVAAPYSLRPKPGAPVSMPVPWEEVKEGLKILDYTIFNAVDVIKERGDLFEPLMAAEKPKFDL